MRAYPRLCLTRWKSGVWKSFDALPGAVILNVFHLRNTSGSLNQTKLQLLKGRRPWCTRCKFVGFLLIRVSCLALHSRRMEVTVRTNPTPPSRRRCGDDNPPPTQRAAITDDPGNKTHPQRRPVHDKLGPLRRSDSPRELSQPWVLIDTKARSSQPCALIDAVACSSVGSPSTPVPDGDQCLVAGDVLLRREEGCKEAEVIPKTPMAVSSLCPSSGGRRRLMMKATAKQAKFRNPPIAFFRRQRRAPKTPEGAPLPTCSSGDRGAGSNLGALPPAPAAGVAASPLPHGPPPHEESQGSSGQQDFLRRVSKAVGAVLPFPKTVKGGRRRRQPTSPPNAIRRSRRVAWLGVEQVQHIPKARKKIMKSILAEPDSEHFSQQNLDAYTKLFQAPLSRAQVEALAALFGWAM
jgi:hypothetical protein